MQSGHISNKFRPQLYTSFAGLNTSRDEVSMERPEAQPFIELDNLYCTSSGYLTNEPTIDRLFEEDGEITHMRFFSSVNSHLAYAVKRQQGITLKSWGRNLNRDIKAENVFRRDASVSSALFSGKVIFAGGGDSLYAYDGFSYNKITSATIKGGRYVAQIQNRLAVAGFDGNPNEIALSRVDNAGVFVSDERVDEVSILKAARFNVQNQIGNGDRIRGIATFENNKFAVFTNDRVLVYLADQDFSAWALDTRLVVRYGTLSHNSIVSVGDEVFFCSRAGVHSLRRSSLNGTTVFTNPLSEDVQELYQRLLAQVENKDRVSAYFNPDEGRLHILFPVNSTLSYRLSGSITPVRQEGESTKVKWSVSTYAGLTCGESLAGNHVVGTVSGFYEIAPWYDSKSVRAEGYAVTPFLWHKDIFQSKRSTALAMYASGVGSIYVDAWNETGRPLGTTEFVLPDKDQNDFKGVPIQQQYTKPFEHEYKGLKLRIRMGKGKMIRVFGIGVLTKE